MNELLFWSDEMDRLFRDHVVLPVSNHPGTDYSENVLLGYSFDVVREQVIAKGLADFSIGYESLTADDKVLLYSFINFKKHFYACRLAYNTYRSDLERWCGSDAPVAVDIGCGPGTAGLALCDAFPGRNWDYVGVDTAPAMRQKAEQMLLAAQGSGLFGSGGTVRQCESWAACGSDAIPSSASLLIICSYLFASASLNTITLRGLADWLRSVSQSATRPVALLVYLNSTNQYANTNYEYFKTLVGLDPLAHQPTRSEVRFKKKRDGSAIGSDEFLHELLILKGG